MKKRYLSNILLIGLVSLFIDMSTEMVYPIVPLLLTSTLGATPAIVGVVEGIAESIASFLKVFSGYIGDRYQNKKRLTFIGYSTAIVYKIFLLISTSWFGILIARLIDRTGKGIRTAPRDALVAQSCEKGKLGGSFGLHKMLDMAGSSIGALLAFIFISTGFGYNKAFIYSIIPAVIGIMIIPFIRENKQCEVKKEKLNLRGIHLDKKLKLYLAVLFLFCLGNSSNTFLLLKAKDIGFDSAQVILLYLIFNAVSSILAIPAGKLSDRLGRSAVLVPGYIIYGLVYIGFALFRSHTAVIILFISYGAYTAFISGAERAFIAEAAPQGFRGTVLGLYGMLQGIGLLLSSIIAGAMWEYISPAATFMFGGITGIASAALVWLILGRKRIVKS